MKVAMQTEESIILQILSLSTEQMVELYFRLPLREDDDPVDDVGRLVGFAAKIGSIVKSSAKPPDSTITRNSIQKSLSEMVYKSSAMANKFCPHFSANFWCEVIDLILAKRYGGGYVYIKANKKITFADVKHLTPKQIMEKFGVSRSYAYKLLSKK